MGYGSSTKGDFAGGSLMAGAEVPSLEGGREVNVEDLSPGSLEMEDWKWRIENGGFIFFSGRCFFMTKKNLCSCIGEKRRRGEVKDSENSKIEFSMWIVSDSSNWMDLWVVGLITTF